MTTPFSQSQLYAYRARRCLTLNGETPARAQALFAPLTYIDNCLMVVSNGIIRYIGPYTQAQIPVGTAVTDLGDVTIVPRVVNAHTHVQLSHLAEKTTWGQGFVPWLASLIPLLAQPFCTKNIENTLYGMQEQGTGYFLDYGHAALHLVAQAAQRIQLDGTFLAEWFGFAEQWHACPPVSARCRAIWSQIPKNQQEAVVPCGHALYSTAPTLLQHAHAFCAQHNQPFVLHVAESLEEVEALTTGQGPLVRLYEKAVLPSSWQAPGMTPVAFAKHLGIISNQTLAVHCVHCTDAEVQILSDAGCFVCLCPRSNAHLHVGSAPFKKFAQSHVCLCLGTDGLTSNTDVNVWQEARYLQEQQDVPLQALLRMLTVNAQPLTRGMYTSMLHTGGRAQWSILPWYLEQ